MKAQSPNVIARCAGTVISHHAGGWPRAFAWREAGSKGVVRLAVVKAPAQSGLLDALLPAFEAQSGYRVDVYVGSDVYTGRPRARPTWSFPTWGRAP
jgi:hypothetical protein